MHCFSFSDREALRFAFVVLALVALFVVGCSESSSAPADGRFEPIQEATPIPRQTPEELGIEPFIGEAVVPNPTDPKNIPDHPILNNDGDSRIHNDHYNTGVYDRPGPTGPAIEVISHQLGSLTGICAMMAMLENGYVIASCFIGAAESGISVNLVMFDNENLDIVAQRDIGPRPFIPNSSGGAYFTMDAEENIIIGPPNNLQQYHIAVNDGAPEFVLDKSMDMTPYIRENALLQDSVIDYEGRLWFMATTGEVGYVNLETEAVKIQDLAGDLEECPTADDNEALQNSIAHDEDGIYMVTCAALYRLSADAEGEVQVDWRAPYESGSEINGILPGSGTSPTLFGTEDDLVTICDNADVQINLLVIDRASGTEVCKTPLFRPGESATENSSIGYGDDVVVANNDGFGGPFQPARTSLRPRAASSGATAPILMSKTKTISTSAHTNGRPARRFSAPTSATDFPSIRSRARFTCTPMVRSSWV
ncbi:MAG: hypothetical protein JRJ24_03220 [Deltaproteobacteria bacterium]|nr:hypothetical protein [Deltaproteobacteria bacterium]